MGITYLLKNPSAVQGGTQGANEAVAAYGQSEAVAVSTSTHVVPRSTANEPLSRYHVRIREASTPANAPIAVFSYPRLEVVTTEGFCLSDFAGDLPAGTYTLCVTEEDGTDQVLPPLRSAGAPQAASPEADGEASPQNATSLPATEEQATAPDTLVVVPAGTAGAPTSSEGGAPVARQGKYAAFLKTISDLESTYGTPSLVTQYGVPASRGVCYARLIDFGDGVERLVVAHYDPAGVEFSEYGAALTEYYIVEVYGYDDSSDSARLLVSTGPCHGQDISNWLTYTTGENGLPYLAILQGPDSSTFSYYGIKDDGTFGLACQTSETFEYVGNDYSSPKITRAVNGTQADEAAYEGANARYGYSRSQLDAGSLKLEIWYLVSSGGNGHSPSESTATVGALAANLTRATTNDDKAETKVVGSDTADTRSDAQAAASTAQAGPVQVDATEVTERVSTPYFASNTETQTFTTTWSYTKVSVTGGSDAGGVAAVAKQLEDDYAEVKDRSVNWASVYRHYQGTDAEGDGTVGQAQQYCQTPTYGEDGYLSVRIQEVYGYATPESPGARYSDSTTGRTFDLATGEEIDAWTAAGITREQLQAETEDAVLAYMRSNPPSLLSGTSMEEVARQFAARSVENDSFFYLTEDGVVACTTWGALGYPYSDGVQEILVHPFDGGTVAAGTNVAQTYMKPFDNQQ